QLGSLAGHAHVDVGGTLVPVPVPMPVEGSLGVPPVVVPPVLHPQPEQTTSHCCPVGQSESARQPFWMLGTQMPSVLCVVGKALSSQPQLPSAFSRQRPVLPPTLPSAHMRVGSPSRGPHLVASPVAGLGGTAVGARRQLDLSQRASDGLSVSAVHSPVAG